MKIDLEALIHVQDNDIKKAKEIAPNVDIVGGLLLQDARNPLDLPLCEDRLIASGIIHVIRMVS